MNPQETLNQLGRGINGALTYIGAKSCTFIEGNNTIYLQVNGRRGYKTGISIKLEANDTYSVSLTSLNKKAIDALDTDEIKATMTYEERTDVYCDELQSVVEQMYDDHMNKHNKGFIPLS